MSKSGVLVLVLVLVLVGCSARTGGSSSAAGESSSESTMIGNSASESASSNTEGESTTADSDVETDAVEETSTDTGMDETSGDGIIGCCVCVDLAPVCVPHTGTLADCHAATGDPEAMVVEGCEVVVDHRADPPMTTLECPFAC